MHAENPEKKEYSNIKLDLTPEQNQILKEICDILNLKDKDDPLDTFQKRSPLIEAFRIKMFKKIRPQKEGFNLSQYLLWHKFINSTPPDSVNEFDIPLSEEDERKEKLKDTKDQSKGYIERFIRNDIKNLK